MEENTVLLRAYARAQERCSRLMAEQAAQIVRLRAALIVRDSALAMVRDELAIRASSGAALPQRVHELLAPSRRRARGAIAAADLREKAVLCVGRAEDASAVARQLVEIAGGRYLHHDGQDDDDAATLESSLRAADLVICQTGCMSHGAYWRVQDHCRRTGKPCVMVGEKVSETVLKPIRIVRRSEPIEG